MAFVNELVPEDQKDKFDINIFYNPTRSIDKRISFFRWVIDRERDIFLIRLGGGGQWEGVDMPEPREYMALSYKGDVVKFEALFFAEGEIKEGNVVVYIQVYNIQLSQALKWSRGKIKTTIKEALEAYGTLSGSLDNISHIEVTFK